MNNRKHIEFRYIFEEFYGWKFRSNTFNILSGIEYQEEFKDIFRDLDKLKKKEKAGTRDAPTEGELIEIEGITDARLNNYLCFLEIVLHVYTEVFREEPKLFKAFAKSNKLTVLTNFFSKKTSALENLLRSAKSDEELNYLLLLCSGIGERFSELAYACVSVDFDSTEKLAAIGISFLDNVKSALKNSKIASPTTKSEWNWLLNVKLIDTYLHLAGVGGEIISHIKSLTYGLKAYKLVSKAPQDEHVAIQQKYVCSTFLCGECINTGNLDQAAKHAENARLSAIKLAENPDEDDRGILRRNPFEALAKAYFHKGDTVSFVKWFEVALIYKERNDNDQQFLKLIKMKETIFITNQKTMFLSLAQSYPQLNFVYDEANKEFVVSSLSHPDINQKVPISKQPNVVQKVIQNLLNRISVKEAREHMALDIFEEIFAKAVRVTPLRNQDETLTVIRSSKQEVEKATVKDDELIEKVESVDKSKVSVSEFSGGLWKPTNNKERKKFKEIKAAGKESKEPLKEKKVASKPLEVASKTPEAASGEDDSINPYNLFQEIYNEKFKGQEIYPIVIPEMGDKAFYFAVFNPPEKTSLSKVALKQHRDCLKKGRVGIVPGIGFKTRVVSHSSSGAGDIRIAAIGDVACKEFNGVTYRLLNFDTEFDHTNQNQLYSLKVNKSQPSPPTMKK